MWRTKSELTKIGIDLMKSAVAKYMARRRKPPSAAWRVFLKNHVKDIIAVDFLVVPTVRNQVLFVFLLLAHERRRVLHFNVTANPTARWTAQQVVEAFPWTDPPKYLLRDRDKIYGEIFRSRATGLVDERHLKRIHAAYFAYYHRWRTLLSLDMDCPEPWGVDTVDRGNVVEIPEIGGLHHHHGRVAA